MVGASVAAVRSPLLLFLMAALCSTLRGAVAAAHRGQTPAAFLLRPAPAPAWTAAATRRGSTATASGASGASSSSSSRGASSGGAGARDFYIEIPDATLPGSPARRVHVLDTGLPQQQQGQQQSPPLVLIGGTAHVINSWVGHTSALARERRLVIYEARGQGRTELDLEGAAMPTHVGDFERVCDALGLSGPIDLAGFSFGGRVALAAAATHPARVRRLVLTGVPADRDAQGRLILKSWRASLERGNLREFAWSSMLLCHGAAFLNKFEAKIPEWIDFVVKNNRAEGILSIVSQSHTADPADPFHTLQLAKRVQCPTLLLGGQDDRVAAASKIQRLAAEAGKGWPCVLIPGTGHNCVFEEPAVWREHVVDFLSSS